MPRHHHILLATDGSPSAQAALGYVADMTTWLGLQVVNRHSAVRIKNLGPDIGKGMTDDLAFEALAT